MDDDEAIKSERQEPDAAVNGESEANEKKKIPPIAQNIKDYVETINSLKESLNLSMLLIQRLHKETHKRYDEFVEKNCALKDEGDSKSIIVPIEHDTAFKKLDSRLRQTYIAHSVVPRSFLVALVSEYDAFLGRLLVSLFRLQPEMLRASDRTLSFSQLSEFSSIEDARDYVLEKEVENFLRQSHSEQFKWLEERFKLPLRKELPAWPSFIEITERRNLFVHTGGTVSRQYIQVCQEHAVTLESSIKVGSTLEVPWKYFVHAHAILLEIGVKLAQVLWRKLQPAEIDAADMSLADVTYELLDSKSYSLAKLLLDFAMLTLKKHGSEKNKLIFVVNRAQAYKWSGDSKNAAKILADTDWTATNEVFQLAHAVLTDNYSQAAHLMEDVGPKGYPHKTHYRDWPLFREFRKSPEFKKAYEKVFGEAFFESDGTRALDAAQDQKVPSDSKADRNEGPLIQ